MNEPINKEAIGKPVMSTLDITSLYSDKSTFYDKWSLFRFVMTNPQDNQGMNVDLRKYRLLEDGSKQYCDERVSYQLTKDDPDFADAISKLIECAIKKGIELDHFRY
jgi:hypothetical protein